MRHLRAQRQSRTSHEMQSVEAQVGDRAVVSYISFDTKEGHCWKMEKANAGEIDMESGWVLIWAKPQTQLED